LVWKTLLALRRSAGRLLLVVGLGVAGLTATAVLGSPRLLALVAPAAFLLYYSLLAETLFAVFVADLERPDLLRPLPLRPWRALAAAPGRLARLPRPHARLAGPGGGRPPVAAAAGVPGARDAAHALSAPARGGDAGPHLRRRGRAGGPGRHAGRGRPPAGGAANRAAPRGERRRRLA